MLQCSTGLLLGPSGFEASQSHSYLITSALKNGEGERR